MTGSLKTWDARKAAGAHYTPRLLADFVAKQTVDAWGGSSAPSILDPALGDGELLLALLRALSARSLAPTRVSGYDTDPEAVQLAQQRMGELARGTSACLTAGDFLHATAARTGDQAVDLFAPPQHPYFDLVIANPPYVRTQVLGGSEARRLASLFGLSGRIDLYFAFLLGIGEVLKPGGIAGVIVSNRFMTTRAGSTIRRTMREKFEILHVWDLGDTRLFQAAVLPAVLLLRRRTDAAGDVVPRFTSIYTAADDASARACENPVEALQTSGLVRTPDGSTFRVRQGQLHLASSRDAIWRLASEETDAWLATVDAHTHLRFGDIGKIRVGVKTTADRVFIRSDWGDTPKEQRPELLRPLTTHHVGRRYRALPPTYQIVYPHEMVEGKRVAADLGKYPRTAQYLERHRGLLESREYVAQAGRQWYELWVPQNPDLWASPKIVFRDISERPTFWLDLDGTVVNGDCYWMVGKAGTDVDELLWLALAVANSTFIEAFYDHRFHNKLYAGRRRFMTQYVEQFPVPDPRTSLARDIISRARELWHVGSTPEMERQVDQMVWSAFGLSIEEGRG